MSPINNIFSVTVISKNDCGQCTLTKRKLDQKNIAYTEINAEEDHTVYGHLGGGTAMDFIETMRSEGKPLAMPIVLLDLGDRNWALQFSGLRPDKLIELERLAKQHNAVQTPVQEETPEVSAADLQQLAQSTFERTLSGDGLDDYALSPFESSWKYAEGSVEIPLLRRTPEGQPDALMTATLSLRFEGPAQ